MFFFFLTICLWTLAANCLPQCRCSVGDRGRVLSKHQVESESRGSLAGSWKRKTVIVNLPMALLFSSADLGQCLLCVRSLNPSPPSDGCGFGGQWCVHSHSFPLLSKKKKWAVCGVSSQGNLTWRKPLLSVEIGVFKEGNTSLSKYYDLCPPTDPSGWEEGWLGYMSGGRLSDAVSQVNQSGWDLSFLLLLP